MKLSLHIEYFAYKAWVMFVLLLCALLLCIFVIPAFVLGELIILVAYLITLRIFKTKFLNILKDGAKLAEMIMDHQWIAIYGNFVMGFGDSIFHKWRETHKYSNQYITNHVSEDDLDLAKNFYNSKFCSEENRVYLRVKWGDRIV